MRVSKRGCLVLAALPLTLLVLVGVVRAITFLTDDGGNISPLCSFLDSANRPAFCSTINPLPVSSGAVLSASDPIGFGRAWFQSTGIPTPNGRSWTGIMIDSNNVVAFGPTAGLTLSVAYSVNGGRSFAPAFVNTSQAMGDLSGVIRLTDGSYIATGQTAAGGAAAFRTTDFASFTNGTGLPAPIATVGAAFQQGATILVTDNTGQVCRSTDNGGSYTCVNPAVTNLFSRMSIASPAASVWLVLDDNGNIARSTNDGTVFVLAGTVGAPDADNHAVACLTSTICLASGGSSIVRSVDAGATFPTTVLNLVGGMSGRISAFANFGNGAVVAVLSPVTSGTQSLSYRSTDFGVTWQPGAAGANTTFPNGNGANGISTQLGAGFYTIHSTAGGGLPNSQGVFSTQLGPGQTMVKGENGATWQLDANGAGIVAQSTFAGIQPTSTIVPFVPAPAILNIGTNLTGTQTGAANSLNTFVVTAAAGQRTYLYHASAFCSAGTGTMTITRDGGTIVWQGPVGGVPAAPAIFMFTTDTPYQVFTLGNALTVQVTTCGVANTSTINIIANRW